MERHPVSTSELKIVVWLVANSGYSTRPNSSSSGWMRMAFERSRPSRVRISCAAQLKGLRRKMELIGRDNSGHWLHFKAAERFLPSKFSRLPAIFVGLGFQHGAPAKCSRIAHARSCRRTARACVAFGERSRPRQLRFPAPAGRRPIRRALKFSRCHHLSRPEFIRAADTRPHPTVAA